MSNFFENSQRYSQVKVHHRYQRHQWQIFHRYQWHRHKIFPLVPLLLLIPVANLPPVSIITAANLRLVSTTPVTNCGNNIIRYRWHLKLNLNEKIYLYVNFTTQKCLNKIMKTFLIEDFFFTFAICVKDTMVVYLELRISLQIFGKNLKSH